MSQAQQTPNVPTQARKDPKIPEGDDFGTMTVNGIEIKIWYRDDQSGRNEARQLAGSLPRGGEIIEHVCDIQVTKICAPVREGGEITLWTTNGPFYTPEGYEILNIHMFDNMNSVTIQKED